MSYSLELRDVRKSYGDFQAVKGATFGVPPGTIFGLLGPNGAGKTSTIRMIMDITAPDSGEILMSGRPRISADLHRIGYLPEERGLYRKMTVFDQLLFLGELHGLGRAVLAKRIQSWLERLEIAAWGKKKIEELSKGMQQKIQLVGTLLHEPDLVILDEPFSGLDPINQGLFKEAFADLKRQGKTILLSTHVMEQAEKLCDHICLISNGRAVLDGELREIKRKWGGNAFTLRIEGDPQVLATLPGVDTLTVSPDDPQSAKVLLRPDANGADVLKQAIGLVRVHEFRSEEPDLEQIFIKAVRDGAQ
ncbi:MAG: ATP-binding cassette domain-containing protein [Acidobacteriota bacterium]